MSHSRIFQNLKNKEFGRLMVIKQLPSRISKSGSRKTIWLCKCDCGKEKKISTDKLNSGNTKSCGCLRIDLIIKTRSKAYKTLSNRYFDSMKRNAYKRDIEFNISKEYIWDLLEKQNFKCALSKLPIKFSLKRGEDTASVDRIDNNKGYIETNIQILDKRINIMKNVFNQQEFINICKAIAKNN